MSNREILASKLSKIVATNKQSVEQVEPNSWKFKGIEVDSKVNDYMVKLTPKVGKSGKTFKKRELYRIVDGAEQKVELGEFKKAYLYKIVRGLTTTKTPRACINRDHTTEIFQMRDYIKASMARHKVPKYIEFVEAFPMNAAGKVLKYKMREDAAQRLGLVGDGSDTAGPGTK
jgi:hypothetical protein